MLKKVLFAISVLTLCIAMLYVYMWYAAPEEDKDILPAVYMTVTGIFAGVIAAKVK